ncbi:hypothetical protein KO507_19875, partial [Gilvimarinus agarilyticus]|uniref:beta strand repeat-containing protein n=1 Tax=Gilvimarinus sp. 2_MG-2023 TaxID=3062666 RepID=UPI0026E3B9AB
GDGGFIETSGSIVKVGADAVITSASAGGAAGTWLLDPTNMEISYDEMGGNDGTSHVHTQALQNSLAGNNVTLQTANSGGGAGDITIADPIIWASGNTLSLDADGGIAFNDYLHAPGGGLTLNAVGNITTGAEGHINVDTFTLNSGNFSQISATLPTFMADDFVINGGTFTRATGGSVGGAALQITDVFGLQGLDTTLNADAVLVSDIDASGTSGWNGGEGFDPIGDELNGYSADFNGGSNVINGLTINRPTESAVGLFANASNATITDVGLTNINIVGEGYVGGLVGHSAGQITGSYATGEVTGAHNVGGLMGLADPLNAISQSYANVAVTGEHTVGGLVGGANSLSVNDTYATGSVTATGPGPGGNGGLIGQANTSSINNSWASGLVSVAGGGPEGGLVGSSGGSTFTNSYWDTFTSGQSFGANGSTPAGISAVDGDWSAPDAYNQTSYTGLDFTDDWFIAEGSSRPMLRAFLDGTNVSNLYQLQGMAADLTANYTLTQDIDASATAHSVAAGNGGNFSDVWGGRGFAPVGNLAGEFSGELDGQGFLIGGLTINRPSLDGVGLFGVATNSSVSDLGLIAVNIVGDNYVGGLIGLDSGSSITDVLVSGEVTGEGEVGGLIGGADASSVVSSYSSADVIGVVSIGGLVGIADGLTVDTSYAVGDVSGGTYSGGLVGGLRTGGSITNSFATGAVEAATNYAGGLVGHLEDSTIETSWASGEVAASGANNGGLVGRVDGVNTYTNNYWDSFTTGQADATSVGGAVAGITAVTGDWAIAETAYSQTSYAGFDFADDWFIAEGSSRPMLRAHLSGGGEIHNLYDLQGMAADLGGNYTLMADIDASA